MIAQGRDRGPVAIRVHIVPVHPSVLSLATNTATEFVQTRVQVTRFVQHPAASRRLRAVVLAEVGAEDFKPLGELDTIARVTIAGAALSGLRSLLGRDLQYLT